MPRSGGCREATARCGPPGVIASAIFRFLPRWNDFLFAPILTSARRHRNIALVFRDDALYPHRRVRVRTEIGRLRKDLGMTVIFVTHDQERAHGI